jgi:peptidoglycan hydrolase-like protein with peptidoglycan-binding domain
MLFPVLETAMVRTPGPVIAALALLGCGGGALAAGPVPPGQAAAQSAEVAEPPEQDDASYRDLVTDAQRLLMLRGFDPGPLDGHIGLRTRRAMRAYQADVRTRGVVEALKGPSPEANGIAPAAGQGPVGVGPAAAAGD